MFRATVRYVGRMAAAAAAARLQTACQPMPAHQGRRGGPRAPRLARASTRNVRRDLDRRQGDARWLVPSPDFQKLCVVGQCRYTQEWFICFSCNSNEHGQRKFRANMGDTGNGRFLPRTRFQARGSPVSRLAVGRRTQNCRASAGVNFEMICSALPLPSPVSPLL